MKGGQKIIKWKEVVGFPRYQVNQYGQIVNIDNHRDLIGYSRNGGRTLVDLRKGYGWVPKYIHEIVAEAFLEPPPGPQYWIAHIDGDIFNCMAENLEWTNQAQRRLHKKNQEVVILETGDIFKNASECAQFLNVSKMAVSKNLNGTLENVKGLHLAYSE